MAKKDFYIITNIGLSYEIFLQAAQTFVAGSGTKVLWQKGVKV